MDTIIKNVLIITGRPCDTPKTGSIYIRDGLIYSVETGPSVSEPQDVRCIIEGDGLMAMPGVINGHCHGCSSGPLFPSGGSKIGLEKAVANSNKMLRQGVTTLINMCGLGTMEETDAVNRQVAVNVRTGACNTSAGLASALMVDGRGLDDAHKALDVETMLESGVVAIGEMGSGASLGGGVTDYKYIPEEFEKLTGKKISAKDAGYLKKAVLGRNLNRQTPDLEETEKILDALGVSRRVSTSVIVEMVRKVAKEPVALSLESFDEACRIGERTRYPVVFHNSLISAEKILELCRKHDLSKFRIVAGHSNHPSFTPEESTEYAKKLKSLGAVIDVSSLDCIITRWMNGPENIIALAKAGLIDTISTDYGGGHWDGILETVHYLINRLKIPVEKAVAMATGNVAEIFPKAAENRGFIRNGAIADITMTDRVNPGRVEKVIVGGKIAFDAGSFIENRSV